MACRQGSIHAMVSAKLIEQLGAGVGRSRQTCRWVALVGWTSPFGNLLATKSVEMLSLQHQAMVRELALLFEHNAWNISPKQILSVNMILSFPGC